MELNGAQRWSADRQLGWPGSQSLVGEDASAHLIRSHQERSSPLDDDDVAVEMLCRRDFRRARCELSQLGQPAAHDSSGKRAEPSPCCRLLTRLARLADRARPYKVASPTGAPYRALFGRKRRAGVKLVDCALGAVVLGASAGSEIPLNEPVDPLVCRRPGARAACDL